MMNGMKMKIEQGVGSVGSVGSVGMSRRYMSAKLVGKQTFL
jgi:hypothetical protein